MNSESIFSDGDLSNILSLKNSFIVFDSESLTYPQIRTLCQSLEKIETLNTKILIAVDKNDLFATENLPEKSVITLNNRFSKNERKLVNDILDTLGVAQLSKPGTILDYIYQVAESSVVKKLLKTDLSLKRKIDDRVKYTASNISRTEFSLLYILAAKQKVPSLIYRGILQKSGYTTTSDEYISTLVKIWGPFIERSSTDKPTMTATHSSFALTSNSQAWLFYALRSLAATLGSR